MLSLVASRASPVTRFASTEQIASGASPVRRFAATCWPGGQQGVACDALRLH